MAKAKTKEQLQPIDEVIKELTSLDAFIIDKKKHGYAVIYHTNDIYPSRFRHRAEDHPKLHNEEGIRYLLKVWQDKQPKTKK